MSERSEKAVRLFEEGYNCSQAVFCAYADVFSMDFDTALRLSAGFGGGFGRMREVCGAFSGVTMIAGLKLESASPEDKADIYEKIRSLAEQFKNVNGGSIVCKDLLGVKEAPKSHVPEERTEKYMKTRPCLEIVRSAAEIIDTFIDK